MDSRLLKELKGKSLIDIEEGRRIGAFEDLLIAPGDFRTLAIITTKALLFNRRVEVVRADDVRVWGRDAILVARPDVIRPRDELPELENAILASSVLRGRSAISLDGRRLGVVDDFYIDRHGRLDAVHLAQTTADSPVSQMKMLPIGALRSVGPDVMIVDMDRLVFAHPAGGKAAGDRDALDTPTQPLRDPTPAVDEIPAPPLAAEPEGSLYGVDTSMLPTLPARPDELRAEMPEQAMQGARIF